MNYECQILVYFVIVSTFSASSNIYPSSWMNVCKDGNSLPKFRDSGSGRNLFNFTEPFSVYYNDDLDGGLLFCVFNQRSGKALFFNEFPLFEFYAVWMDLERHLKNLSPGRIVVMYMQGNSAYGLRNVTELLAAKGSLLVEHLNPKSTWTWSFVNGGKTIFEKLVNNENAIDSRVSSSQFTGSLLDQNLPPSSSGSEILRWELCDHCAIMGDLCDESKTADLNFDRLKPLENALLKTIPVIVTAGKRTSYLYQSIKSFLNADGVVKNNIHVLLGSNSTCTIKLLKVFNITYTYIPPSQYKKTKLFPFLYYKEVYKYVIRHYPNAPYAIFLEEDIEVTFDFFSFISQMSPILLQDPSLYCIAGFSAVGMKGLAHDTTTVLRATVQVGWGYALTLSFIKEVVKLWPIDGVHEELVYDGWIYKYVIGDRECILPEVGRTSHFGIGMNTNYWLTEKSFFSMPTADLNASVIFSNVDKLRLKEWNVDLREKISNAIPTRKNPCRKNFFENISTGSYVMYYNYSKANNDSHFNYGAIAVCFNGWIYSAQGQHDHVAFMRVSQDTIYYLVAYPESQFSDLKPGNYSAIDLRSEPLEERNIYIAGYNYIHYMKYLKKRPLTTANIGKLFT